MPRHGTNAFESFSRLEEAATFFLYSAFDHVQVALQLEVAGVIFAEMIDRIEPEPGWVAPSLPTALPDFLNVIKCEDTQVISDSTSSQLAAAWDQAQTMAVSSGRKLGRTHTFERIEILGCVIDLAACVEAVINRHLFYMRESGRLEDHLYASLDRTEVVPKILFAFKDEVQSGKLPTGRIVNLFRLRNQAVHFKASTANSMSLTPKDLLDIWREVGQLLEFVEGRPTQIELCNLADEVKTKWVA
jgi:hypothetical protein